MHATIAERRLQNQCLMREQRPDAAGVVEWLGAVQAQEFHPATWALALRMPEGTVALEIGRAFDEGRILRTHVMRPTWHFVPPSDIRWMLELTAPRVHRIVAPYNRRLGLDAAVCTRAAAVVGRSLRDGRHLTRAEIRERLARAGLEFSSLQLAHVMLYAELEAIVCSGPRRDKQFTYALLAERAPRAARLSRDEALAELTRRYFRSHGPATVRDFVWWSGLTTADAKRGLEVVAARRDVAGDLTYWSLGEAPLRTARQRATRLLPVYDEYLVAYRDREAVPHGPPTIASRTSGPVTFQHALIVAGQVAGTWRTARTAHSQSVNVIPLRRLTEPERRGIAEAVARYQRFLDAPVTLSIG